MKALAIAALAAHALGAQAPAELAARAEAAARRGDAVAARAAARALVSAYERDGARWPSGDHVAAGRAYVLLGAGDPGAVRAALGAFDAAVARDSSNLEAYVRLGELFLDKYNAPDARAALEAALRRRPDHAPALVALARVTAFEQGGDAMDLARRAAAADPRLAAPHALLARFHLDAEAFEAAAAAARAALARDPADPEALGLLGATAWVTGDSATFREALARATAVNPRPAAFYAEIADAAVRQRRYADAVRLARTALALDSSLVRALGLVGTNELRAGDLDAGRATLERAFALDPFNVWHKNTLDLLDRLRGFRTVERGRFRVVAPPAQAELLAADALPLLDEAYEALARRYGYRPPPPIRVEFYARHADFSVRTVGLAGLGALGVSFGRVLAMDAPAARARGEFNWGSTLWHELAHTFTLGLSGNRVPRWLSEGLSVLEERRARPGWGADASLAFVTALRDGWLRPVSALNDGFVRPRRPEEVGLAYYQASLVCEMLEAEHGAAVLPALLRAYAGGADTPAVLAQVLRTTPDALDRAFDAWVRRRFAGPLAAVGPAGSGDGPFVRAMRRGIAARDAGQAAAARAAFAEADALWPDYAGSDGPAMELGRLAEAAREWREAAAQYARVTARDEAAWDANVRELAMRERLADTVGARAALERMRWIDPADAAHRARLAELAGAQGDHAVAVRERRAVLALHPTDALEARYQLARALAAAGDAAQARRELLRLLEQAPAFEKAQALLLALRDGAPPPEAP